jgi:hypothetical protein
MRCGARGICKVEKQTLKNLKKHFFVKKQKGCQNYFFEQPFINISVFTHHINMPGDVIQSD